MKYLVSFLVLTMLLASCTTSENTELREEDISLDKIVDQAEKEMDDEDSESSEESTNRVPDEENYTTEDYSENTSTIEWEEVSEENAKKSEDEEMQSSEEDSEEYKSVEDEEVESESTEVKAEASVELMTKTYNIDTSYKTPGWEEKINIDLDVENWIIVSIDLEAAAPHNVSKKYQWNFKKEAENKIVWLTLEQASEVSVVGWASLTTWAFKKSVKEL